MKWKTLLLVFFALVVGLGVLVKIATRTPLPPQHQVFINGDVLTMDADNRVVQALSTRGELIEAVGSTEEIMALVGDDTEVVDLRGRTLLVEKRHPTRTELDGVSTEHPVVAMHVSGHMLVANSVALELVDISADTPDPEGGVIDQQPGSMEPCAR